MENLVQDCESLEAENLSLKEASPSRALYSLGVSDSRMEST